MLSFFSAAEQNKMKLNLNLELSYDEAVTLAKYLPTCDAFRGDDDYDEKDEFLYQLKSLICNTLQLDEYELSNEHQTT